MDDMEMKTEDYRASTEVVRDTSAFHSLWSNAFCITYLQDSARFCFTAFRAVSRCRSRRLGPWNLALIEDFEAELFDNGIGEDFLGDPFDLFLSFFAARAVELQDKELSLAYVLYVRVAQRSQRPLDRLSLRIENRRFQHDPDVSCHL